MCLAPSMYMCPVCGYPELAEEPWDNGAASDEICPCCGTHFGYDDSAGGDAGDRERVWRALRLAWEDKGCPWFSSRTTPRAGWNPHDQLLAFQ